MGWLTYLLRRRITYFVLCGAIAVACVFLILWLQPRAGKIAALPQHPQIQVYFNHNPAASYTDPYRKIKRSGDNLEQIVIDNINQAKVSVDIAVQELRLPNIARALIDRKQAGIKVRLILENKYSRAWHEYSSVELEKFNGRESERYFDFQRFADSDGNGKLSEPELDQYDAVRMVKKAELNWLDDTADGSKGSGLMHHKFVVIDNRLVLLGSANFTLSDLHGDFVTPNSIGNNNNLVKIDNKEVANAFTKEFNLMWGDGPGGKPDSLFGTKKPQRKVFYVVVNDAQVRIKFSPERQNVLWEQTTNGLIGTVLSGAHKAIDMALFVFSDPLLSNILEVEQQRGVQIRALVDPNFAYRKYSSTLDMWGFVSSQTCKLGDRHPWKQPLKNVGVPDLATGDLLHHKFSIVDYSTVVTGSHNWSNAANYSNDEALVVIQHPMVAQHFQREFDQLFKTATLGPTAKLSKEVTTSCPPSSEPPTQTQEPATPQPLTSEPQ